MILLTFGTRADQEKGIKYINYSAYPDFHSKWAGFFNRLDSASDKFRANDTVLKRRPEICLGLEGCVNFDSLVFVTSGLLHDGKDIHPGGYGFQINPERRVLSVFGVTRELDEIIVSEDEQEAYRYFYSEHYGVLMFSFPAKAGSRALYWAESACGLLSDIQCRP